MGLGSPGAHAAPSQSAFTQLPSRFVSSELTLGYRALGETCYSRAIMPDGTVCDPAFLGEETEASLLGRIYVANGYSAFSTANNLIFQPITQDFLRSLFDKDSISSFEANLGLVFAAKNFSASFSPYLVQYFSEIHNPNFPVVAIHAAVERSLTFSGGTSLDFASQKLRDFSFGATLRLLQRTYVHGEFSLADVLVSNPSDLLPVKTQYAAIIEPAVGWHAVELPWKPRVSVGLTHLGPTWPGDPLYPENPDVSAGLGIEPPLPIGTLQLGVDAVDFARMDPSIPHLRLGGSYRYGILEGMVGWNSASFTAGMQFGFQIFQAGIVYQWLDAVTEGGETENKIATEFSIRL